MSAEDFSDFDRLTSQDRPPLGPGAVGGSPTDGSGNPGVNVDLSQVSGAEDVQAIELLSGTGYLKRTGTPTWALVTTVPWSDISGTPTTLAGYGIVDAQPLDGDLTAIAALTGTNTLYYRSGASAWSPVTIGSGITFSGGTLSAASGSGDFVGPGSATDNAIVRFDGTTGKLGQNSLVTIDDNGIIHINAVSTNDSGIELTSSAINTRLNINNTHASPNVGIKLLENGTARWTIASYNTGTFTFYNETTVGEAIGITAANAVTIANTLAVTNGLQAQSTFRVGTAGSPTGKAYIYSTGVADNLRIDGTASPGLSIANAGTVIGYWAGVSAAGNFFTDAAVGDQIFRSEGHDILFGSNANAASSLKISSNGKAVFAGSVKTAAPASGTAAEWKLGSLQTNYAEADIAGTAVKLARSTRVLLPLFDHFADAGNTSTTETDLYSDTIAASQLGTNGDKLELEAGGVFVSSATATRQVKLYFGGTAIFDTGALTLSLSAAWTMFAVLIRVSSSVIRYTVSLTTEGAALAAYTATGELTGLTLSATNTLKITGTAAGVGAATNDIVAKLGAASFIPAA